MKKLLVVFILCLTCLLPTLAEAKIYIIANNLNNTVNYCKYNNVGMAGVVEYGILKNVDKQEHENYYLFLYVLYPVNSSVQVTSRFLIDDIIDFSVDGKDFKATKIVNDTNLMAVQGPLYASSNCYFRIPDECVKAVANAKNVSFTIHIPTKKPEVFSLKNKDLSEVKNMIANGHFSNYYTEDINILSQKYSQGE